MPRQWLGMKDGETDVGGEHPLSAIGVSYQVNGELRRRLGQTKLCDLGGKSITVFTDTRNVTWLVIAEADGEIRAVNLATPTTSTVIKTGYDTTNIPIMQAVNGRLYITNGVDPVQVWNGLAATMSDAGIDAPAAAPGAPTTASGNGTAGVHLIRYRYIDNTSPGSSYRSDASANLTQTVTASGTDGQMTFSGGASGTNIIWSTDTKATTIQVEMTLAGGTTFYVAATATNAATAIVVNISDTLLVLADRGDLFDSNNDVAGDDLGGGHEKPPLGTIIAQCRDHTFLGGDEPISKTMQVTNASTTVGGTAFPLLWGSRYTVRFGSETKAYEISSVGATGTALTLANAYTGSTATAVTGVVVSKNPNRINWCGYETGAVLPESWRYTARGRDVLNTVGDTLCGYTEFNGDLIVCGRFAMQRLVYVDDPGLGELDTIQGQFGVFNQRCFVKHEGILFGFGPNGVWMTRGGRPLWISDDIDVTWAATVDLDQDHLYHASYNPIDKTVRWFMVADGATTPREVFALDLTGMRWYREQYRAGIDGSTTAINNAGQLRSILSDATNGRTFLHTGATDGVPSGTGAYTGNTGSTTTVTEVNESLPTGTLTDLSGLMLYRPGTGESVAVTSNTASAITHAAFATAVAVGEEIYAGAIPWSYETSWWTGDGLPEAKRANLVIECQPSGSVSAKARVSFYRDWETSPQAFTAEAASQWPRGVTVVNGRTYAEIEFSKVADTSGFLKLPLFLNWNRAVRAKVEVLTTAGTLRITDIRFELPKSADSKPKITNE